MTTSLAVPTQLTLLREVSDGPVAAVFAGESSRGDAVGLVAVKVLRRVGDAATLAKARAEGRRLGRLGHGHIVAPTDVALVDGNPALLSTWVEGIDLLDWVEVLRENDIALPTGVICAIGRSAASAIDAALHRVPWGEERPLGLLHRDIKPSNLMISREGHLKVLDFGTGLTSLAGPDAHELVRRAGIERYLSPERRAGEPCDPGADMYSLGILLIELLHGRWLRRTRRSNPAHDRHLAEVVAGLPEAGLPSDLDERAMHSLLLRMVAFDPEARPGAGEVAQTLRMLADRASGPSLESFAHDHALPHLEVPQSHPGLPGGRLIEPEDLPERPAPPPLSLPLDAEPDDQTDEADLPSDDPERHGPDATTQAFAHYSELRAARKAEGSIAPAPRREMPRSAAPWFAIGVAAGLGALAMLGAVLALMLGAVMLAG